MRAKPYEVVRCKGRPGIAFPVEVGAGGSVVDADGHIVAVTFAPMELEWMEQERYRHKMAELIAKAMNAAPH